MIIRTRMGMIMITEGAALLRLLACASPAFPTGGFAYSGGLEWAVEEGAVGDEADLAGWLSDVLLQGSGRCDAIFVRQGYQAQGDAVAYARVSEIASAMCWASERLAESTAQGAAFAAAAQAWGGVAVAPYPVAFGAFAAAQGIGQDDACLAFLANWTSAMISAAIRLGVLGQAGGLRVMAALEAVMIAVAAETAIATLDDLGGTGFLADIAAMRHETQYARLFRS